MAVSSPTARLWKLTAVAMAALYPWLGAAGAVEGKRIERVVEGISPEMGRCYIAVVDTPSRPDSPAGAASVLRLFEDDRELGPPHSVHHWIRQTGRGAFSHWCGSKEGKPQQLYFSASDNSDPRTNGRTYKWVVELDAKGTPVKPMRGLRPDAECRLQALPAEPLARDRHTMILAGFDASDHSNADYARTHVTDVGTGSTPDAPGRFGNGVAVHGSAGAVRYPGLDNYNPQAGTVEFWAQSAADQPIWTDSKTHWLVVLYPERGGAPSRYGQQPYFIALCKSDRNTLNLRVVNQTLAPYNAAVRLRNTDFGWTLSLPVDRVGSRAWHHIVMSWDLRKGGRLWLLVDGVGVTAEMSMLDNAAPPNPGIFVVFGGFWGLPGDEVSTSECNLDDLRVQDCTVKRRLVGAEPVPDRGIDEQRLIEGTDLARATLDKLIDLQFQGGWAASYNWPTYTMSGWSLVGRGVDMWFVNTAWAGGALMRGWLTWGDDRYLDAAIDGADMFCRTQMENGTWSTHYTYSRGELQPWRKSAYIAQRMQSNQIRFLCMMHKRLGYQRYEAAIRKAGDWMASIQFPNGAWGWESYPLGKEGPHGHPALNDAVTPQVMWDLFIIWLATGDEKYRQPVLKGAQWLIDAQAKPPTYGWADQYDEENNFIWMRNFEPPAVSMQAIRSAQWGLCLAYDLTGDDRYLTPLRNVLKWMDTVPEDQRGWLWYDPKTSAPVVAYYNEMLPVTHEKAIKHIIPRLSAHYGVKHRWMADLIRSALDDRKDGPVYPDWRGQRPRAAFDQAPTLDEFARCLNIDQTKMHRERLAAWLAGDAATGLVGSCDHYGRLFLIQNAIAYCERLLSDIECAQVALGDRPAEAIPRYARGGNSNWTYMAPRRHYFADTAEAGQENLKEPRDMNR